MEEVAMDGEEHDEGDDDEDHDGVGGEGVGKRLYSSMYHARMSRFVYRNFNPIPSLIYPAVLRQLLQLPFMSLQPFRNQSQSPSELYHFQFHPPTVSSLDRRKPTSRRFD